MKNSSSSKRASLTRNIEINVFLPKQKQKQNPVTNYAPITAYICPAPYPPNCLQNQQQLNSPLPIPSYIQQSAVMQPSVIQPPVVQPAVMQPISVPLPGMFPANKQNSNIPSFKGKNTSTDSIVTQSSEDKQPNNSTTDLEHRSNQLRKVNNTDISSFGERDEDDNKYNDNKDGIGVAGDGNTFHPLNPHKHNEYNDGHSHRRHHPFYYSQQGLYQYPYPHHHHHQLHHHYPLTFHDLVHAMDQVKDGYPGMYGQMAKQVASVFAKKVHPQSSNNEKILQSILKAVRTRKREKPLMLPPIPASSVIIPTEPIQYQTLVPAVVYLQTTQRPTVQYGSVYNTTSRLPSVHNDHTHTSRPPPHTHASTMHPSQHDGHTHFTQRRPTSGAGNNPPGAVNLVTVPGTAKFSTRFGTTTTSIYRPNEPTNGYTTQDSLGTPNLNPPNGYITQDSLDKSNSNPTNGYTTQDNRFTQGLTSTPEYDEANGIKNGPTKSDAYPSNPPVSREKYMKLLNQMEYLKAKGKFVKAPYTNPDEEPGLEYPAAEEQVGGGPMYTRIKKKKIKPLSSEQSFFKGSNVHGDFINGSLDHEVSGDNKNKNSNLLPTLARNGNDAQNQDNKPKLGLDEKQLEMDLFKLKSEDDPVKPNVRSNKWTVKNTSA